MRRSWLAIALVTAAFAGCLGSTDDEQTPTEPSTGEDEIPPEDVKWAEKALPDGENHDHTSREGHRGLSTENFDLLGFDPLITEYHNATSGDYFCGEVAADGEQDLAVTHGFGNDVAFVVADVSNPDQPEKLGELVLEYSHTYDVSVTPDGQYVALAISGADTGPDDGPAGLATDTPTTIEATYETRCGETVDMQFPAEGPYQSGVLLVDISDPASPEITDYEPQPAYGPHSIFATEVDDTYHILASTTNLEHQASYFTFFGIESTPAGGQLVQQAEYTAQQPADSWQGDQPPLTNGHIDGWIQQHPVTNATVAYLANWNGGMHVVELSDTGVERLAIWNNYDDTAGDQMTGQVHGTYPLETTWDGKHYTFAGQEVTNRPAERPSGEVIMFDTTDPANPEPVARWTLPDDVSYNSLMFSTHYFTVVDQTLFVSNYHGGVWAVDASPEAGPELPTEGVFVPDRTSPQPPDRNRTSFDWTPTVLDVLALPSGDLVLWDATSGIYTVGFDESVDVPSPDPWTADAWIGQDEPDEDPLLPIG